MTSTILIVPPPNLPFSRALDDLNSKLELELLPEPVMTMVQKELYSLMGVEAHHRLLQSTDSERELARLCCLVSDRARGLAPSPSL